MTAASRLAVTCRKPSGVNRLGPWPCAAIMVQNLGPIEAALSCVMPLAALRAKRAAHLLALLAVAWSMSGCDQLGVDTPAKAAERKQAEARAIGSACRHAMRAIEDCYVLNPKAEKSAVFAGWREMDEYMRENKLDGVAPVVPRPAAPAAKPSAPVDEDAEEDPPAKGEH